MNEWIAGGEGGTYWQRPWRLKAAVVYGWRAHRHRLSSLLAHPNELLVATAGRGNIAGQELDVVRCWNLAYAAAGICHSYALNELGAFSSKTILDKS